MPYYRLYCINQAGNFFHCDDIEADTDDTAIEQAIALRADFRAELWQQARLFHSFVSENAKQDG